MMNNSKTMEREVVPASPFAFHASSQLTPFFDQARQILQHNWGQSTCVMDLGSSRTGTKQSSVKGFQYNRGPVKEPFKLCTLSDAGLNSSNEHFVGHIVVVMSVRSVQGLLSCTSILISLWSMGQPMNNKIAIKSKHTLQCDRRKGWQQCSIWESAPPQNGPV